MFKFPVILINLAIILLMNSCSESNTDKIQNSEINSILVPANHELLVAAIGFVESNYGPIMAITERTLIYFQNGKVDYCLTVMKPDSSVYGISFSVAELINGIYSYNSSPGYYLCNQELSTCYNCELEKPTSQDPHYYCSCSLESHSGGGNGACSLIHAPGPNPSGGFVNTYFTLGNEVIANVTVATLSSIHL